MPSFYVPLAHVASRLHLRAIKSRVIINQLKYFSTTPPPSSSEQSKTTEPNSSPSKSHDNGGNHSESGPGSSKESPSSGVRGPITYFSLALTGLVGASIVAYYSIEKEKRDDRVTSKAVVSTGKPALGGPWSLVDSNGVPRTSAQFHGRFSLLYFGFTHCPDICPSELVKVGKIIDTLDKNPATTGSLIPIFVSVDPARDSVGQIRSYSQDFHPKMVFLTGTQEQVARVARFFRVYFSKADEVINEDSEELEYLVDHSIVLYLMSPEGEFVDFFTQRTTVGDVVSKIENYVTEYRPSTPVNAPVATPKQ